MPTVNAGLGAASVAGHDAVPSTTSVAAGLGQVQAWGHDAASATLQADPTTGYAVAYGNDCYAEEVVSGPADIRRTVLVSKTGATVAILGGAVQGSITQRLNDHDTGSFTLPVTDPDVALIAGTGSVRFREVQMWRGSTLLLWGPIIDWSYAGGNIEFVVAGASWHLTRRRIGPLAPENEVGNGSFELGFDSWSFAKAVFFLTYDSYTQEDARGTTATKEVALVTVGGATPFDGSTALRLAGSTTYDYDQDLFAWQEVTVSGGELGRRLTLSARGYLYSSGLSGYSAFNRGVMLERLPTTFDQNGPNGGKMGWYTDPIEWRSSRIDENTPTDRWVEHVATLDIDPGASEVIHVRLNSVNGVILWDDVRLDIEDRLEVFATSQADIIEDVVEHAQSTTYGHTDFNLLVSKQGGVGPLRDLVAIHAEQAVCWDLITTFTRYDDGVDLRSRYTRTNRFLEVGHPRLGVVRNDRPLWTGIVASLDRASGNGTNAHNAVAVRSDNTEAPTWGSASDTSPYADSQVHETSIQASVESNRNDLDADATEYLASSLDPTTFAVTLHPSNLADYLDLRPGDWCPTNVVDGALSIIGTYRIVGWECGADDLLRLEMGTREAPS